MLLHFLGNVVAGVLLAAGWVDSERVLPLLVVVVATICVPAFVLAIVRLESSAAAAVPS